MRKEKKEEKKKETKKVKKRSFILSDFIGPIIAIENIFIILFYFYWYFVSKNKVGFISYFLAYIMVMISIFLIILSVDAFIRLILNKEKVTKNLKQEKITTSVVGMILGLILLLFTYIVAGSINYYNNPVKACDNNNDVINDIKRGDN